MSTKNIISKNIKLVKKNSLKVLVLLIILVIIVTLALRKYKREDFAVINLADASWVTRGETGPAGPQGPTGAQGPAGSPGAKGDDGAQGLDGTRGPQGEQGPKGAQGDDYIPSQQDKDNMYNEFKNKIMKELEDKKIISREGTKYFPNGVINMQHKLFIDKKKITTSNMNNNLKYFNVKYNKQSTRSYVKITYSVPITGHEFKVGAQFRVYVKEPTVPGDIRISSTVSTSGAYTGGWDKVVPKSITVTGIDAGPHAKQREYYLRISNYGNNDHNIMINGVEHASYQNHKYNHKYYLMSSVLIEEIVLPTYNAQNIKNIDFKID